MNVIASEIEDNVQEILKNLMNNLASLGYEYGFELNTTTNITSTTAAATTTTKPPLIGDLLI